MRARRLIAAGVLTAATFSSTVAGLAITGTLDKALAALPPQCNPKPVSGPVSGPAQNPGQQGQNPGQKGQNAQCQPPPPPLNSEVSGNFSGMGAFTNPSANCGVQEVVFDATYTTSTGTGSFVINACGSIFPPPTFLGSFTLTAPDGATLQGTASGTVSPPAIDFSLSFTLTPTSGTDEFANVTGVINLTGTWLNSSIIDIAAGSLSGALMSS